MSQLRLTQKLTSTKICTIKHTVLLQDKSQVLAIILINLVFRKLTWFTLTLIFYGADKILMFV